MALVKIRRRNGSLLEEERSLAGHEESGHVLGGKKYVSGLSSAK
jgi:hypothetical protein